MAVSLVKRGTKVNLSKENPSLKRISVALGWDANRFDTGGNNDLDVSVFPLQSNGKVFEDRDLIFFNNLVHYSGAIKHSGDERTGEKEKDDEVVTVDFGKMPNHIEDLHFVITIHDNPNLTFGQVRNAYARIDDADTNVELYRYDLEEDFSTETGILVCRVYKKNNEWRFSAEGKGYKRGLDAFVEEYGLEVE